MIWLYIIHTLLLIKPILYLHSLYNNQASSYSSSVTYTNNPVAYNPNISSSSALDNPQIIPQYSLHNTTNQYVNDQGQVLDSQTNQPLSISIPNKPTTNNLTTITTPSYHHHISPTSTETINELKPQTIPLSTTNEHPLSSNSPNTELKPY